MADGSWEVQRNPLAQSVVGQSGTALARSSKSTRKIVVDESGQEVDDEYWLAPPEKAAGEACLWVDCRINIEALSKVDTVNQDAHVKISIIMYWTDARVANWPVGQQLPKTLWGPCIDLPDQAQDAFEVKQYAFALTDSSTGRLKRDYVYSGQVDNHMNLRKFPMDLDAVRLNFPTTSTWESRDGSTNGEETHGTSYRLRSIQNPAEGQFTKLWWNGKVTEFAMQGISTMIDEEESDAAGAQTTHLRIEIHLARNSIFYFWKALMPLYLLTSLSFCSFAFATDDIEARFSIISTYFLAAFAMLYVVGESLPKTDFLTKIDQVIVITTASLAFNGAATAIINMVHQQHGARTANEWNTIICIGLFTVYCFLNFAIFVPAMISKRSATKALTQEWLAPIDSESDKSISSRAKRKPPPTVRAGRDYKPLAMLHIDGGENS